MAASPSFFKKRREAGYIKYYIYFLNIITVYLNFYIKKIIITQNPTIFQRKPTKCKRRKKRENPEQNPFDSFLFFHGDFTFLHVPPSIIKKTQTPSAVCTSSWNSRRNSKEEEASLPLVELTFPTQSFQQLRRNLLLLHCESPLPPHLRWFQIPAPYLSHYHIDISWGSPFSCIVVVCFALTEEYIVSTCQILNYASFLSFSEFLMKF